LDKSEEVLKELSKALEKAEDPVSLLERCISMFNNDRERQTSVNS